MSSRRTATWCRSRALTALAYRGDLIYGGTSIHGGLDSTPTQTTAELFIWSTRENRKVFSKPVVPGATIIHALTFDKRGRLWGMADNGVLFEFDVAKRKVVRSIQTNLLNDNIWGRLSELYYRDADGYLYGNAAGRGCSGSNLHTFKLEVLVSSGVRVSGLDRTGALYFGDETNIYRYHL